MWLQDKIKVLLWWLNLAHIPEIDNVPDLFRRGVNPVSQEEEEVLMPFDHKQFVIKGSDGKTKVVDFAAYKSEKIVNDGLNTEWTLERLDLSQSDLIIFSEWSRYDELVLNEKGWTSTKRISEYKKIRACIIEDKSYQQISDHLNISLSKVKQYGSLVKIMMEYRRQAEMKV